MRPTPYRAGFTRKLLSACALGCLLAGCSVVGPTAIRSGRLAYNDAINETNRQQLLMVVIYNRYEEEGNLLAVSSVTANVSVRTSGGIQIGYGDADHYAGNLVPFSAGTAYEENPTISYTPVAGEKYTRQLLSPLPINLLALFAGTVADPEHIYTALIANINGIHNPDFLFSPSEIDPRFSRVVAIMTSLTKAQCLHWIEDPDKHSYSIVIDDYAPAYTARVNELLHLLGLPAATAGVTRLILPVSLALHGRDSGGIGIITRSVFDLGEILSAAIEVPEDEKNNGVAITYPPPGLAGKDLRIRSAIDKPEHAYISVKYHDRWFYIDAADQATKRFFRLTSALWSVTIAESTTKGSAAPVLTVPVSR
jgi:hypothetical protein